MKSIRHIVRIRWVTALKTMPKVEKPATKVSTNIHAVPTTSPVALKSAANIAAQGNPLLTGSVAVRAPGAAGAGPATTVPGQQSTAGQPYVAPKKSNKGLFITLAVIGALVAILVVIMNSGSGKTGAEIAAERAKKEKQGDDQGAHVGSGSASKSKNHSSATKFPNELVYQFDYSNGSAKSQRFNVIVGKAHKAMPDGLSIAGSQGSKPGIKKRLTDTDVEDMFKRGWSIKYESLIRKGRHVIGLHIPKDKNRYWRKTSTKLAYVVEVSLDGDDVVLEVVNQGKKVKLPGMADKYFTIELRGTANDKEGNIEVLINGKPEAQLKGHFLQDLEVGVGRADSIFSTSASSSLSTTQTNWKIKKLSLSTGAQE